MISFNKEELERIEHLKKINLINSATGYKPANLIGTRSKSGISNLAIFSSITHYGSSPAIYGFVIRPTHVPRNTYENIKETGVFTINSVCKDFIEDAHHTSAKYGPNISEFDMTNLEEEFKDGWPAPFVKNAPIQIAMKFLEEYHIKVNGTLLVLSTLEKLYVKEDILNDDLFINLSSAEIATINGLDAYAVPTDSIRLPYQRPREK